MHSLWKGFISFGLVNIPVRMYSATKEKELSFVLLHKKDHSHIRYARICKTEGKEVPWEEIVKGYEVEKGEFVELEDKDFEKANLKKTKSIEIICFIEESEINSVYYVKPYFIEPEKEGAKAYTLLAEALKKTKKVGLAKYVLKNREHLAVIKLYDDILIINELRYQSEVVKPKDIKVPASKISSKELSLAAQLIDQQTEHFKPAKYKDTYVEEMKAIIKQKAKGRPIRPKTKEAPSPKVHDIMSLLEQSFKKKKAA